LLPTKQITDIIAAKVPIYTFHKRHSHSSTAHAHTTKVQLITVARRAVHNMISNNLPLGTSCKCLYISWKSYDIVIN